MVRKFETEMEWQFRDPEAQVDSRCSRMRAWASHSVVRSRAKCMHWPLYEPTTPMVLTVIHKKTKATSEVIKERKAIDIDPSTRD